MNFVVLVISLAVASQAGPIAKSYEGYKVYQLKPTSQEQLVFLDTLKESDEFDFWSEGRSINSLFDILVGPQTTAEFENSLRVNQIPYEILIEDVKRIVEEERIAQSKAPRYLDGEITFSKYHRYQEFQAYLKSLQQEHPDLVTLHNAGKSHLGRELTVIQISTNPAAKKPILFIDGGIHAREWIAPATALYVIQQLVENTENHYLLELADWHILPLLNPDGYEYSQTVERFWRKNRSTSGHICKGVDLNRNFGDHWGGLGTSTNPCSEIYIGTGPFSEPEAKALQTYLLSIKGRTKLYLSLHNYGQYILHPWGYGPEMPEDAPELARVGQEVAKSIEAVYGTEYEIGSVTQLLPPGAGGSDDWAKSGAGIKYSYTFELPGGGKQGFDLPPTEILRVVTETFEGVKTFYTELTSL